MHVEPRATIIIISFNMYKDFVFQLLLLISFCTRKSRWGLNTSFNVTHQYVFDKCSVVSWGVISSKCPDLKGTAQSLFSRHTLLYSPLNKYGEYLLACCTAYSHLWPPVLTSVTTHCFSCPWTTRKLEHLESSLSLLFSSLLYL